MAAPAEERTKAEEWTRRCSANAPVDEHVDDEHPVANDSTYHIKVEESQAVRKSTAGGAQPLHEPVALSSENSQTDDEPIKPFDEQEALQDARID